MKQTATQIIESIERRPDDMETMIAFLVPAAHRFRAGQRVEFTPRADRAGVTHRKKGGIRTGKLVGIPEKFSVRVLLDGYRQPTDYFHAFFTPATKRRRSAR